MDSKKIARINELYKKQKEGILKGRTGGTPSGIY